MAGLIGTVGVDTVILCFIGLCSFAYACGCACIKIRDRYYPRENSLDARVSKIENHIDELCESNRNMMREIIRINYNDLKQQDYVYDYELEHIEKVYEIYHKLGGNGTADRWIEELKKMDRKKH